jgi:hypothetical protein
MAVERRWWHRLRLTAGPTAVAVSGQLAQQERLEGQEAFSATIRVAGTPTATEGDAIDLYLVDLAAGTGKGQLSGQIDEILGTSYPHEQLWVCTDVMAKLRLTQAETGADPDLWLGGPGDPASLTDGEAVQLILTTCGVAFDPADIQDCGYVLGQKTAVYWMADVTGAEIIADIDRVFQCRTMSVGAGRVCRVRWTLAPDAADAVAAYTRGNATIEPYLFGAQRNRGRFDDIRNSVRVRGTSYECGDDGECTCDVWARADADHPALGAGKRTRPLDISSEFIQDAGLAEEVARDAMRRWNRTQDRVRVRTENDPNVTVGKVVTVLDDTAAVDLAAAAPYTVVFIDRVGNAMTLEAVGGAAGATGTVTSGIEQVCQDLSFDLPETPSFSLPDFGAFPDIAPIAIVDPLAVGGEQRPDTTRPIGGGGGGTDLIVSLTDWTCEAGTCDLGNPGDFVRMGSSGVAGCGFTDEIDLPNNDDWTITATLVLEDAGSEAEIWVGDACADQEAYFGIAIGYTQAETPGGSDFDGLLVWNQTTAIAVTITHDHGAGTTRFEATQSGGGDVDWTFPHATHPTTNRYVGFRSYGGGCRLDALSAG